MKIFFISVLSWLLFVSAPAPKSIVGDWKTIDDETNKPKSVVHIFMSEGKAFGKITRLFRDKTQNQDPLCDKCTGYRKNQKIIGMQIVNGLVPKGDIWEADNGILDPNNGKFYDCEIWLDEKDPKILHVRGYIGFLYRTQTWYKYEGK